jgi:hypothetical protein
MAHRKAIVRSQAGAAMELSHNRQQRQIARAASAKSRTCWNPITAFQPSARLLDVRGGATTEMGHPRRCRSRRSSVSLPLFFETGCRPGHQFIRSLMLNSPFTYSASAAPPLHHATGLRNWQPENSRAVRENDMRENAPPARSSECRSRISSHISGGLRSRSESQEAVALEILACGGPRPMMMSTMSTP